MNGGQPVNCSYMCHEPFFESCCVGDEQTPLPERGRAFGVRTQSLCLPNVHQTDPTAACSIQVRAWYSYRCRKARITTRPSGW